MEPERWPFAEKGPTWSSMCCLGRLVCSDPQVNFRSMRLNIGAFV